MTTFDLPEIRGFTANLVARLNQCDNGERMQCATLDAALRHYAALCCEYRDGVRQWGQAIFAGRAAFDPDVERVLRDEGGRLYARAVELLGRGRKAEGACYALDGDAVLRAELWELRRLLDGWVTPKLSVGPAARRGLALTPEAAAEAKRRVEALPPLPADWQPADPRQQRLKRLQGPGTP